MKEASISKTDGQWNTIGTMSGTSLDGLDICTVQFTRTNGVWNFDILEAETIPYSDQWRDHLSGAHLLPEADLNELDWELSAYIGSNVHRHFHGRTNVKIDGLGSHGHTVFHDPIHRQTLQIGNQPILREKAGLPTVCNFRVEDVAMGGQGAPLVPIGDEQLFPEFDVCVNLGGFSNLSTRIDGHRIAWDIAPCNIGINRYANLLGLEYDEDGRIAKSHIPDQKVLLELNALPYYSKKSPKSLGREWLEEFVLSKTDQLSPEVAISTLTYHSATQISNTLNTIPGDKTLLTGGGTRNAYLIELIQSQTKSRLHIPNEKLIDYKEALIFAFLGLLKTLGEVNILSSVTGAPVDHSAGTVYL